MELYDENKRKVFIRRDDMFNETDFGHTNRVQLEVEEEDDSPSNEESARKSPDVRRSARERKPPVHSMMNTLVSYQQSTQPSL